MRPQQQEERPANPNSAQHKTLHVPSSSASCDAGCCDLHQSIARTMRMKKLINQVVLRGVCV